MKLLKQFIQQETVLTAAAVLAVVSAFFVPPDAQYLGYIDLRTLAILFSLMTVMAGLRRQGFFDGLGRALLSRTHSTFQLTLVLVGLCFFGSMFITNDVSLLTFVPFTFVVLSRLGADVRRSLLIPVVCMQTIAANLGSMLTPIGNPQNLYLYGKSGMSIGGFVLLMLPYTLVSLLLLLAWAALVCRKTSTALSVDELVSSASQGDQKIILLYLVLFAVCLLSVIRVLPYGIAFAAVLVCALFADPHTLRAVDYSLLLTFVAFFIFIGNLGRIPAFSGWLQEFLTGREVLVAVLASQVTSNVPAALLLSGFTAETQALIIGTNLGGLGTLIASMASLISYRQIARELPQGKKQYFGLLHPVQSDLLCIPAGRVVLAPLSVADDLWFFYKAKKGEFRHGRRSGQSSLWFYRIHSYQVKNKSLQNNHYKAQIVSGQLLLKGAGKQHPHPHGHPCVLHCLSPNPIFTICIFIPLSPTLARNRKKPLTEESFRSL